MKKKYYAVRYDYDSGSIVAITKTKEQAKKVIDEFYERTEIECWIEEYWFNPLGINYLE